jgi:hypothetical protein
VVEYETDDKGTTRKDGKVHDTIPTYVWVKFVGGNFDKQEVVGRDLERQVVRHGEDEGCIYSRRVHVFGPMRVIAYVDVHHPRSHFWPYEVLREMARTHPALMTSDLKAAKAIQKPPR